MTPWTDNCCFLVLLRFCEAANITNAAAVEVELTDLPLSNVLSAETSSGYSLPGKPEDIPLACGDAPFWSEGLEDLAG